MKSEVEQRGKMTSSSVRMARIGQHGARLPQLIEELVDHGIDCRKSLGGRVLEQLLDQLDCIGISLPEHLRSCKLLAHCRHVLAETNF